MGDFYKLTAYEKFISKPLCQLPLKVSDNQQKLFELFATKCDLPILDADFMIIKKRKSW